MPKKYHYFFIVLLLLPFRLISKAGEVVLQRSLVKVFTTAQEPDYYEPWRIGPQKNLSGSGCVIAGNRILTNAHVVSNAIFIQVLKEGDTKKYVAKREFVAHDSDLAILTVNDPKFFQGTQPVTFGGLPSKRDKVAVYGFPVGGEELSITEGVVSRIEISTYAHSTRNLLAVQTDAAINPGNSGGPAFKDNKMVGVAFQGYNAAVAQSTGYLVPVPVIKRFFSEIERGRYRGVPYLGIYGQFMEHDPLREHFGMQSGQTGVLVTKTVFGSSVWGKVQVNDVLLSIDGYPIANDGTIMLRKDERVHFSYPLCLHRVGDSIALKMLRDRELLTESVTLKEEVGLVPRIAYDVTPTYFIFDGLIFTPFNSNYPGNNNMPSELKELFSHGLPSPDRKEVVLLNHILSHSINKGYDSRFSNLIVTRVNGHSISEMKDLIAAFEDPRQDRHVIDVDKPKEVGTKIVLDATQSKRASAEILAQYNIPSDRSLDLAGEKP